jgi:hypothetical protein
MSTEDDAFIALGGGNLFTGFQTISNSLTIGAEIAGIDVGIRARDWLGYEAPDKAPVQ